jgi:hypothetical protein
MRDDMYDLMMRAFRCVDLFAPITDSVSQVIFNPWSESRKAEKVFFLLIFNNNLSF